MAGKKEYVSVLERGDMSSPAYRAYLENAQALEGSHPEMFVGGLAALARQGANTARGLLAARQRPYLTEYEIANMQHQAAFKSLTKDELAAFNKNGTFPADWEERVKNASWIGSGVGKVAMPGAYKKTPQELLEQANKRVVDNLLVPTARRTATDAAIQTGNQMQDIYNSQQRPTQEEVVNMLRGYAYGGMILHAGNNKLV